MLFGELIHNTFRSETERSRFSDVVNVYVEVDAHSLVMRMESKTKNSASSSRGQIVSIFS